MKLLDHAGLRAKGINLSTTQIWRPMRAGKFGRSRAPRRRHDASETARVAAAKAALDCGYDRPEAVPDGNRRSGDKTVKANVRLYSRLGEDRGSSPNGKGLKANHKIDVRHMVGAVKPF